MTFKKGNRPWNKNLTYKKDNRLSRPWLDKKRPEHSKCMKKNNPAKRPDVRKKLKTKAKQRKRNLTKELRYKLGKGTRGKTYEEIYGKEKAEKLRKDLSAIMKKRNQRNPIKHTEKTKEKLRAFAYRRKQKYVDTKPELFLQNKLLEENIKFEKHKMIYGSPDIFIEPNICIFVDGEYWHNYPSLREIDLKVNKKLKEIGYLVLRFWVKKEIYKDVDKVISKVKRYSAGRI